MQLYLLLRSTYNGILRNGDNPFDINIRIFAQPSGELHHLETNHVRSNKEHALHSESPLFNNQKRHLLAHTADRMSSPPNQHVLVVQIRDLDPFSARDGLRLEVLEWDITVVGAEGVRGVRGGGSGGRFLLTATLLLQLDGFLLGGFLALSRTLFLLLVLLLLFHWRDLRFK
ncbi:hypothetical protein LOK49_LG03G03007 [Camellia lanceoleosa]|uniref:Uncharacterized protein n=1 Tax=Camellia lanceoleosa TaxID=1840588 RepID=A0ACC0I807_9ERIC|nr:hypothetical protein LOK49_LG03G03007 [Camellia lanceoleosa]